MYNREVLPHLIFPDRGVGTLGALELGHEVLLVDALDVSLHDVRIGEGVVAIPADVALGDAVVENDAHVDLAIAVTDDGHALGSFLGGQLGPEKSVNRSGAAKISGTKESLTKIS